MTILEHYRDSFPRSKVIRCEDGVLEAVFQPDGDTCIFNGYADEMVVDSFFGLIRCIIAAGANEP